LYLLPFDDAFLIRNLKIYTQKSPMITIRADARPETSSTVGNCVPAFLTILAGYEKMENNQY
jgi:hypothetical protein